MTALRIGLISLVLTISCNNKDKDVVDSGEPDRRPDIVAVDETESWAIEGMTGEGYVLRTEMNIPHIYAENVGDLGRIEGFTYARDRFFFLDLARRLALGEVSGLLGDIGLEADLEARGIGGARAAANQLAVLDDNPELAEWADGYAAGVNAYIEAVQANQLPLPTELEVMGPLLGAADPSQLMEPFDRYDVAACTAFFVYFGGYESSDIGRTAKYLALDTVFDGAPLEDLRKAGVRKDLWDDMMQARPTSSAEGWGLHIGGQPQAAPPQRPYLPTADHQPKAPAEMVIDLADRLERMEARHFRDRASGFGSNAWAVAGSASSTGHSLVAGDGHLKLSAPNYFFQMGIDTEVLGGGDLHAMGMMIPGLPAVGAGTNGQVAWSSTAQFPDATDWYTEEIQLDSNGEPAATLFQGEWMPVTRIEETYEIANVPILGSTGRTESWPRWKTFDGRLLTSFEGVSAKPDDTPDAGQTVVQGLGKFIIPQDTNGDGVVSGISFAFTALAEGIDFFNVYASFNKAADVYEVREATKGSVGTAQNQVFGDSSGNVLFSPYEAIPCREYLPRDQDRVWLANADPRYLIDGTEYGGFAVPMKDGLVDESQASDPYKCTVPHDQYPASINPVVGYVRSGNNDPGNIATDGSLYDDPYYIGGPWEDGYRPHRLDTLLPEASENGWADLDGMATIQADHKSLLGEHFTPVLLDAIAEARSLADDTSGTLTESEARTAALYTDWSTEIDEVESRLTAWSALDFPADSGVETFYETPESGDADNAVATSLFNAWFGNWQGYVISDEGPVLNNQPTGATGRTRALKRLVEGIGPNNPGDLGSWNPDTEESAYFDIRSTPEIETSTEVAILSLVEGLEFLASEPVNGDVGGFGSDNFDDYLWGLRHQVQFVSTVGDFMGDPEEFKFLTDMFVIDVEDLPLAESLPSDDPRAALRSFPRHGDNLGVDNGNGGYGDDWRFENGAVFRMVIELDPDHPRGHNILPGGQSGLPDSEHYNDQTALWLGNETVPMRIVLDDVLEGATGRETFTAP